MIKYISPEIKIEQIEANDIILASNAVSIVALEGVDENGSKTAIFDASHWIF